MNNKYLLPCMALVLVTYSVHGMKKARITDEDFDPTERYRISGSPWITDGAQQIAYQLQCGLPSLERGIDQEHGRTRGDLGTIDNYLLVPKGDDAEGYTGL